MIDFEIPRPDFHYALRAVVDHAGDKQRGLDYVGVYCTDWCVDVFATDGYTAGLVRLPTIFRHGDPESFYLPVKEAKDLIRFVKPNRVADKTDTIRLVVSGSELHVGITSEAGELQSEVYTLLEGSVKVGQSELWQLFRHLRCHHTGEEFWTVQATLLARFKSAEENEGDRMHLYRSKHAALITVGSRFIGALEGLQEPSASVTYGDATLEDWGL